VGAGLEALGLLPRNYILLFIKEMAKSEEEQE